MSTPLAPVAHMTRLVRDAVPRVHPAATPILAGVAGGTALLSAAVRAAGWRRTARTIRRVGAAATAGSALFFRVPDRVPPTGLGLIVAPADGVIAAIGQAAPPPETGLGATERTRISIFLSVLDVHVQFAPVAGSVAAVHYHPGQFLSADLDKASEVNERNSVVIRPGGAARPSAPGGAQDGAPGDTQGGSGPHSAEGNSADAGSWVVATQIAGLIARRIVCEVSAGDDVRTGDVYGLIRFGSRLDTYLPLGAEPCVRIGQRAVGGETVLAELAGGARA